ncbi:MAG: glycosyltransferase family 2 protein [Oscillibacter sp.]|nr:glycosyltransferase family 2 protein [Oscillibacter sp.]
MPGVSIITPVYQAERTLAECVESVLGQTFSDWELLLVDDGSTDAAPALCRRYAARDSRVRVLSQPVNGGVSAARNRALREARGEYIAFLDADDCYLPRTLETLWNLRLQAGADAAGCAHWNVPPLGREWAERLLPAGVYDREQIRECFVKPLFGERLKAPLMNGFLWRFLLDAGRARELAFQGAYLEDELFLLEYFCSSDRLAVTEEPLYRYYVNPASATRHYMRNLAETLDGYMDRKEALADRYGLDADCPGWRDNTRWANLLIAIGNAYARGIDKNFRQRREDVEALCRVPETAEAIARLKPEGLGRNKQIVADLVRGGHFHLLTLLYRVKNRM